MLIATKQNLLLKTVGGPEKMPTSSDNIVTTSALSES